MQHCAVQCLLSVCLSVCLHSLTVCLSVCLAAAGLWPAGWIFLRGPGFSEIQDLKDLNFVVPWEWPLSLLSLLFAPLPASLPPLRPPGGASEQVVALDALGPVFH